MLYINVNYYKKIVKIYQLKFGNMRFGIVVFNKVYTMIDIISHHIGNLAGNESILSF